MIARRSIIKGLVALVAAPAIIKVADLMPVNAALQPGNSLLTIDQITREAVQLFKNSNEFLRKLPEQYRPGEGNATLDVLYGNMGLRVGDVMTLLDGPSGNRQFVVTATEQDHLHVEYIADKDFYAHGEQWSEERDMQRYREHYEGSSLRYNKQRRSIDVLPQIPAPLALAAAAVVVAPVLLEKPVTRRFWAK